MERRARAFVYYYGARLSGLSLSNEHRIVRPVHMRPLNAQRLANTKSLPTQRDCNRADVIGVSLDKVLSLLMRKKADALIADAVTTREPRWVEPFLAG